LDELTIRGDEGLAAARLAAELPNLRAAFAHASELDDLDARAAIVLHLADLGFYREYPELHVWSVQLANEMRVADHPCAAAVLAASARAAWLRGELDVAAGFAEDALRLADEDDLAARSLAYDGLGVVAMLRGEFERSQELCTRAAEIHQPLSDLSFATAALAAAYDGNPDTAAELLDRSRSAPAALGQQSRRAFVHYVEGEMAARGGELDLAIEHYATAIELGRSVDATFMQGIATVGLVSAWGRTGRISEALDGYRWLVDYWRRAGNWPQMWTTFRNLAGTLADAGKLESATFVLAAADHADDASPVDDTIAPEYEALRLRLADALGPDEYERIRRRVATLPRAAIVEEALAVL
jgi:tetratricopeptide (TPR) repeat protein